MTHNNSVCVEGLRYSVWYSANSHRHAQSALDATYRGGLSPPAGQVGGARGGALPLAARRSPSPLRLRGPPVPRYGGKPDGLECSSGEGVRRASPLRRLGSSRRAPRCPASPPAPLRRRTSRCGARGYALAPVRGARRPLRIVGSYNACLLASRRSLRAPTVMRCGVSAAAAAATRRSTRAGRTLLASPT